jgi:hypothetical protein
MGNLEEKFREAVNKRKSDINNFIWKDEKKIDENGKYKQSERRLVDMSQIDLKKCYEHCKIMLYNQDSINPGRYLVLELISDQKERCGAELFLRWMDQENGISRFTITSALSDFLVNNKETLKNTKPTIDLAIDKVPDEFKKLSINLIIDGGLDKLGAFNKKHITRTFILKQGIWLTSQEAKDLEEYDDDNQLKDRLEIIRERLDLKEIEKLYINAKGLSYSQMRSILQLRQNRKYADFTTIQLETLRYRILFDLEESVKSHILAWEKRMEEIELVSEHLGYKL